MRRIFILIVAFLLVVCGLFYFITSSDVVDMTGERMVRIVLTDEGYEPRRVRISKGTDVQFSTTRSNRYWPASNTHPAHDIFPEFDPRKPLDPSEVWNFTFDRLGTWHFHDHVRSYFTGTIYVIN